MHDRYLTDSLGSKTSEKECRHTYHGTAIFSAQLKAATIPSIERDPLWATATLLCAIIIASVEAITAEEAWPLAPPSPQDLDWLCVSNGKKEVWRLVDPLRKGGVWKDALSYDRFMQPESVKGHVPELEILYPYLTQIWAYNPFAPSSEKENRGPYHTAASILTRLLELDCNHSTIMFFLSFLSYMDPRFRQLLQVKDPKALLLLSWWYGKTCQYNAWWMMRRTRFGGQAICFYLERNHGEKEEIVRLLEYPKMMTGLVES